MELTALTSLAARALQHGGRQTGPRTTEWEIAGKCERPIMRELHSRHYDRDGTCRSSAGKPPARTVRLSVRCRRCAACLARRRYLWASKAKNEIGLGVRTWFVTLTFDEQQHFEAQLAATQRLAKQGVSFKLLSDDEQFLERHKELGRKLTLYLKRLRAHTMLCKRYDANQKKWVVAYKYRARFRYLIVSERHKTGLPHYHMLLHELDGNAPLKWGVLHHHAVDSKLFGFIFEAKLADAETAAYVTKYLTKSPEARVRASGRYGHGSSAFSQNVPGGKGPRGKPPKGGLPPPQSVIQPIVKTAEHVTHTKRHPPRVLGWGEHTPTQRGETDHGSKGISDHRLAALVADFQARVAGAECTVTIRENSRSSSDSTASSPGTCEGVGNTPVLRGSTAEDRHAPVRDSGGDATCSESVCTRESLVASWLDSVGDYFVVSQPLIDKAGSALFPGRHVHATVLQRGGDSELGPAQPDVLGRPVHCNAGSRRIDEPGSG